MLTPPLTIEIHAPTAVAPGKPFHVVARLVNRSSKALVVARPFPGRTGLGVTFDGGLFRQERPVATASPSLHIAQTTGSFTYGRCFFTTLKPGESVPIEDTTYQREVRAGATRLSKREFAPSDMQDFPEGTYTLRFQYGYRPANGRVRFTPEAKTMSASAWKGLVEGKATVVVSGATRDRE